MVLLPPSLWELRLCDFLPLKFFLTLFLAWLLFCVPSKSNLVFTPRPCPCSHPSAHPPAPHSAPLPVSSSARHGYRVSGQSIDVPAPGGKRWVLSGLTEEGSGCGGEGSLGRSSSQKDEQKLSGQRREWGSSHFLVTSMSQGSGRQHGLFREFEVCWYMEKCTWNVSPAFVTHPFLYRSIDLHLLFFLKSVYVEEFRTRSSGDIKW